MGDKGGRIPGQKNLRSYLAGNILERLGVSPIEELLKIIKELDELKEFNIEAYVKERGHGEKMDAGTAYLSNAIRCTTEKSAIYTALAKFKHPTLSAVGIQEIKASEVDAVTLGAVNAIDIRNQILNDPFALSEHVPTLIGGKNETTD